MATEFKAGQTVRYDNEGDSEHGRLCIVVRPTTEADSHNGWPFRDSVDRLTLRDRYLVAIPNDGVVLGATTMPYYRNSARVLHVYGGYLREVEGDEG